MIVKAFKDVGKLLKLQMLKFTWTKHGYIYSTDEKAMEAFSEFKRNYYKLSKENRKLLDYYFDDQNLSIISLKEKHEVFYIGVDRNESELPLGFQRFMLLDLDFEDLTENLKIAIMQTRRG